jgi:hypothetical protein
MVAKEVTCVLHPKKLPNPLPGATAATRLGPAGEDLKLDLRQWVGDGIKLSLTGDEALIIRVR